jgi:hypothetical protein
LEKIESEQVNITWRFRDERAGFFGTQLLITRTAAISSTWRQAVD